MADEGRLVAGRYRLISELGAGGYGRVWKARDENLRVDVAVKAVELSQAGSGSQRAERVARAMREARNAARLRDHPNIVAVHDVVTDGGVPWIVMELVIGHTLTEEIDARGRLPAGRVRKVARAVLEALRAAHTAGIVHRDVKPSNVLLADDGRILLADFGTAVHGNDTKVTGTGMLIGSAEYLAPERIDHGDDGPAGDLFSLGVTLYQAAEGVSPFHRPAPVDCLAAVLAHHPPPPQHAGELASLITSLLGKDPRTRPTADAALTALKDRPAHPPTEPSRTPRRVEQPIQPQGPTGSPPTHSVVYRLSPKWRAYLRFAAIAYPLLTIVIVIALFLSPDGLLSSSGSQAHNIFTLTLVLLMVPVMGVVSSRGVNSQLALTPDGVQIRSRKSTFIQWSEIRSVLVEDAELRRRRVRFVLGDKSVISPFPTETWAMRDREFDQKVSTIRQWHAHFGSPEP